MYACLAVTCHLHFWQNDRDFLRATVVTRGWNGYRNKSQHRKSTLEKKILPPFQQGFEPATFQSRVRCSNHWAITAPLTSGWLLLLFLYIPDGASPFNCCTLEQTILRPMKQGSPALPIRTIILIQFSPVTYSSCKQKRKTMCVCWHFTGNGTIVHFLYRERW